MRNVLILSVGGSHEPIAKAIDTLQPDYVCFVCSDDDPASGEKGSYIQITGKGKVIKVNRADKSPTLPNIPTQTGLDASQFEVIKVSPDDFDDVYRQAVDWMCRQPRDADQQLVADYTGGTKTMSAALAVAALDCDGVDLQLVSGSRSNLVKVESGSEQVLDATVEGSRFCRKLHQAVAAWQRFAYEETAAQLGDMRPPRDRLLRGDHQRALDLSRAFAAWDRFDHAQALVTLTRYKAKVGKHLGVHIKALSMLNETQGNRREPLQLYDLWLNAQRRAEQGRYDDAIARVYRLLEWTAQWQLRRHADIETANIPKEKIPTGVSLSQNREGHFQAGLFAAWQLIEVLLNNAAAVFFRDHGNEMLDHLKVRNQSILAHGFSPIDANQWKSLHQWMASAFIPMLKKLAADDAEIRFDIDQLQLPTDFSAID